MKNEMAMVLVISGLVVCVECCNEATCGSIVSKCLLTKACTCDLSNRECSKDCFSCLGHSYTECCGCLNMCPKEDETPNVLNKKSHVEDYLEPVPELFNVITEYPDELNRWDVKRYPVDISQYTSKKKIKTVTDKPKDVDIVLNCTVVFWSQCMSWMKCKNNCLTMGSSSYRWFHDGCCECVGQNCINYGLNESRCRLCPLIGGNVIEEETEDDLDYGEDDDYMEYVE